MSEDSRTGLPSMNRRDWLRTVTTGTASLAYAGTSVAAETGRSSSGEGIDVTLIEKDEEKGFNFPYYLYAPADAREKPLVVETVNSGGCDDDFQVDLDTADRTAGNGVVRTISDELRVPLIVPVFANPCEGEFWNRFIQTLDTETMHIESGKFERIDRQLLRMIEDAQERLSSHGIDVPDEVMLNGFSASGNFMNNFTALHPERVASVTAGAINGMAILPFEEGDDYTFEYQIGIADVESLIGEPFDRETWRDVPQFCYMGEAEEPPNDDTLPFRDVWSEEQARKARSIYGDNMQQERMTYSETLYDEASATARFEVYDDIGHTHTPAIVDEVVDFHRRHNDIQLGSFAEYPEVGTDTLVVDLFVPQQDGVSEYTVRSFIDGSEANADTVSLVPGAVSTISVPLTRELAIDETVTVGVFDSDAEPLSDARLTFDRDVIAKARFDMVPGDGDAEVEVSYALSASRTESATLSVVPAGDEKVRQRRVTLETVAPGQNETETFQLDTDNIGVPFESGDEVQLWLVPPGRQTRDQAVAVDTVTIGGEETDESSDLVASSCDGVTDLDHEEVDIGFAEPPTVSAGSVAIEYSVAESYEQKARTRLFPESGGGRWGIGLDRIEPGTTGSQSYGVDNSTLTLGERVEARAFPNDWGFLEDVIASECAVVSGVRFDERPMTGDRQLSVKYMYPESVSDPGEVRLSVGGDSVDTIEDISPGTFQSHSFDLSSFDGGLPGDTKIELSLVTGGEAGVIDSLTVTTRPSGIASLTVPTAPSDGDTAIPLDFVVDESYQTDRFLTVRLYTEESSSWGILVDKVGPGDDVRRSYEVGLDEPGVPFESGQELRVAIVDSTDPYAEDPLITTAVTAGSDRADETDAPRLPGADGPPRDIDGDGTVEDVNGDGVADADDAMAYYANRDSDAIRNNPEQFDFDDDGEPGTVFDVVKLFNEINDQ